jgi:GT2 family glycosyltransferase
MDVARRTAAAAPWELKLIAEPVPGVSRARNRGVAASRGGIIVFLDDDCYISPEFFRETLRIFGDPSIGFAGGRALPFDETDQPVSIFPMTELKRFPARGAILPGEMPGSGMAVRRAAWDDAGGYDESFGPGAPLLASEDVDLQQRLLGAGWDGLFDPRLWIYHHHGRKGQKEAEQSYRAYDTSVGALYMKRMVHGPARSRYLKRAYWEFRSDLQRGRGRRYPRMLYGALLYVWTSATRMVRG